MTIMQRQNSEIMDAEFGEKSDLRNQPSSLEAITRAEIDVQIATAKRFPRDLSRFVRTAKAMVASDPELAAQCTYYLPERERGKGPITGPSVRLAEIVAVCWGNLRIVGRVTDDDGKTLTIQGGALDLESNVGYSVEVKRGVTTKDGRRYGPDMIKTTANAGIAIATRNATFKVVPKAFVNLIEMEADRVAKGDVKSLPERAEALAVWFEGKGVKRQKVYAALGIGSRDEVTFDILRQMQGMKVAVNEGTPIEELLAVPTTAVETAPSATKADTLANKLKGKTEPKAETPKPGSLLPDAPETGPGAYGQPREPGSDG